MTVEPVRGVVGLGVGHERTHRHRVVAQHALQAVGRGGRLGAQGEPVVHALGDVVDRADQRLPVTGATAEDDAVDLDPGRVLEVRRDVGHVGERRGEPAVGVGPRSVGLLGGTGGDRVALPVQPAVEVRRLVAAAFPPDLLRLLVVGDVGEDRAGAGHDRVDRGRVGPLVGVLRDPEDAVLRVHPVELAVVADPQPRDVVAVELDVVAVAQGIGRQRHRQVGLARRAREATADVVLPAGLLVGDAEQHELLHQEAVLPAVVGPLAQAVGDLAEQRVAAVRRPEVQDRALVGHRHEVALVVGRALAEVLEVTRDVHGLDEGVAEVVEVLDADPRHPDHLEHHTDVVGELDTGGKPLQRGALRRHQVGDDVHRLAGRRTGHQVDQLRLHLRGRLPVVVGAPVGRTAGGDDGALLGARGVLEVGARVVEALAGRQQHALGERHLDQARVVGCGDDLHPSRAGDAGPVLDVLPHVGVGESGFLHCPVQVCHFGS